MSSDDSLLEAWEQSKDLVFKRIGRIEKAVLESMGGSVGDLVREDARREAHRLAGSLGSFGFPTGSQLAGQIEQILATLNTPEDGYAMSFKISELRSLLEGQPQTAELDSVPTTERSANPVVMFLGNDGPLLEKLKTLQDVEVVDSSSPLLPTLIFLDDLQPAYLDTVTALTRSHKIRVAALAPSSLDLKERVAALRAGVLRLLDKQGELGQLVEEVRRLAHQDEFCPRVLALDDDPIILKVLRRLLQGQGINLETVQTPQEFWHSLRRQRPDLVLLDLELPDYSGQELTLSMRADPSTETIPIIILTATQDPEIIENLFAAGADDCLSKPIRSRDLLFRLRNRLSRVQALRSQSLYEESGVWSRQHCLPLGKRLLSLAERTQRSVSVSLVKLQGSQSYNATGALGQAMRSEDLVARWNSDTLLVGLYGSSLNDSNFRLNNLLQTLIKQYSVEAWCGLAEYPAHGGNFEILIERARACLDTACSQPSGQIVTFGYDNPRATSEMLDVVVVEDDPLLGQVVVHALSNRNYSLRWFQDGAAALEALTGNPPPIRPRLVLLDVDLPGYNGLEILRRLKDEGVLRRTRVIMLTVRSNEQETLETLSLGAYDHLAKPCSLQVLLQRVQLALNG